MGRHRASMALKINLDTTKIDPNPRKVSLESAAVIENVFDPIKLKSFTCIVKHRKELLNSRLSIQWMAIVKALLHSKIGSPG